VVPRAHAASGDAVAAARYGRALALAFALVAAWSGAPALAAGETVHRNVPYENVDGQTLSMDVSVPPGGGTHPGVLLIHGGGFSSGRRTDLAPIAQRLSAQGYVAFTIDYQLAPDAVYPAQLEDAIRAVAFMRANAARFHVDPARIAALGSSAGGTIAATLGAVCGRGDSGGQVAAVAAWSGPMDLTTIQEEAPSAFGLVRSYVFGRSPDFSNVRKLRDASPVSHVGPDAAPMLLSSSSAEPIPFDQYTEMATRLRQAGVPVRLVQPDQAASTGTVYPITVEFFHRFLDGFHAAGSGGGGCGVPPGTVSGPPGPSGGPGASTPVADSGGSSTLLVVAGAAAAVAVIAVVGVAAARRRRALRRSGRRGARRV
jgi:acetyl esterase/lipase